MARWLVTGSEGFVGRHVREVAAGRGHEVVGFDRSLSPPGDVRDPAAVTAAARGCDAILHLAAVVGPVNANADPRLATEVNVAGTQAVLEAARAHGIPVVALSTATLYGNTDAGLVHHEDDRPDPVSLYDATKLMGELMCDAYAKTFGVAVTSIRTGFVYGHGHSSGRYMVNEALRGEPFEQATSGDNLCDFTYVVDLARGLVLAAERMPLPARVYNVTGGRLLTRRAFAGAVRRALPEARIAIGDGVDMRMHRRGVCSLERARQDFGYEPQYDLDAGLADWIARARGAIAAGLTGR